LKKEIDNSEMSLAQETYIASESLRITSRELFAVFAVLIAYSIVGIVFLYVGAFDFVKFWLPFTIIIISAYVVYYYSKARGFYQIQKDWVRDFVESQYILIVNTSMPSGNTTAEKIFNLCRLVFPELREDYARYTVYWKDQLRAYFRKQRGRKLIDYAKGANFQVTPSYTLDVALKTINGYFIIKDFKEKAVTTEELNQLKDVVNGRKFRDRYYRLNVFRVICIGRNYDNSFFDGKSLEQKIKNLDFNFKIDLLLEERLGFTILWTS
jgi:hypothetical protein